MVRPLLCVLLILLTTAPAFAQAGAGRVAGRVNDETGAALPGVTVELRASGGNAAAPLATVSGRAGEYAFDGVAPGTYQLNFMLINFASATHRDLPVAPARR